MHRSSIRMDFFFFCLCWSFFRSTHLTAYLFCCCCFFCVFRHSYVLFFFVNVTGACVCVCVFLKFYFYLFFRSFCISGGVSFVNGLNMPTSERYCVYTYIAIRKFERVCEMEDEHMNQSMPVYARNTLIHCGYVYKRLARLVGRSIGRSFACLLACLLATRRE